MSLSDLPWDTVGIIFDFTPSVAYKQFRLNKTFTRLINKRRKGLTFRDGAILPETLRQILCNNQIGLKELRVLVPIKRLRITLFDQFQYRPKSLQVLDLKKLETIGETAMSRILASSARTLHTVKLSYRNEKSICKGTMAQLAACYNLKVLEFATLAEYISNLPPQQLTSLKYFLARKKCALESLKLYDCDKEVLEMLARGPEKSSLEELQIIKFN